MMENYSKREIDFIIKGITDHIDSKDLAQDGKLDNQDKKLDKILAQVLKTNGRVSRLEGWRSLLAGAWIVVSAFVIPLLIYVGLIEKSHIEKQIIQQQEVINSLIE